MNKATETAYTGVRHDVVSLVPDDCLNILDVGCSTGKVLEAVRVQFGTERTVGIEGDAHFVDQARNRVDRVLHVDLDDFDVSLLEGECFDVVIFADVLEHLRDPRAVMEQVLSVATTGAAVIVSIPNAQHWTVIANLVRGRWPKRDRGIFDRTHLQWFTFRSFVDLASSVGLGVEAVQRNVRLLDAPGGVMNSFSRLLSFWPLSPFVTYQYVIRLRRRRDASVDLCH